MSIKMKLGSFPDHVGGASSHKRWVQEHRSRADSTLSSSRVDGYRMRKARILSRLIDNGQLGAQTVTAVERDYARELRAIRREKKCVDVNPTLG
tara:strand:- start:89 stop:370 length:282 start_codon:yes stop_codon:yes gene_type:complete